MSRETEEHERRRARQRARERARFYANDDESSDEEEDEPESESEPELERDEQGRYDDDGGTLVKRRKRQPVDEMDTDETPVVSLLAWPLGRGLAWPLGRGLAARSRTRSYFSSLSSRVERDYTCRQGSNGPRDARSIKDRL
jgi:hypothetical protein